MKVLPERRDIRDFLNLLEAEICALIEKTVEGIAEIRVSPTVSSSYVYKELDKVLKLLNTFVEIRSKAVSKREEISKVFLEELRRVLVQFFKELSDDLVREMGIPPTKVSLFIESKKARLEELINSIIEG